MIFEQSEAVQDLIDAVHQATHKYDRGDVIPHDEIRSILDVGPHEGSWDHVMKMVRRRVLQERRISIWPVHGVGYRFQTTEQQLQEPAIRAIRAKRQFRRARASVSALPVAELSLHQQHARSMMMERMEQAEKDAAHQGRIMTAMTRKQDGLPRVRPKTD